MQLPLKFLAPCPLQPGVLHMRLCLRAALQVSWHHAPLPAAPMQLRETGGETAGSPSRLPQSAAQMSAAWGVCISDNRVMLHLQWIRRVLGNRRGRSTCHGRARLRGGTAAAFLRIPRCSRPPAIVQSHAMPCQVTAIQNMRLPVNR